MRLRGGECPSPELTVGNTGVLSLWPLALERFGSLSICATLGTSLQQRVLGLFRYGAGYTDRSLGAWLRSDLLLCLQSPPLLLKCDPPSLSLRLT